MGLFGTKASRKARKDRRASKRSAKKEKRQDRRDYRLERRAQRFANKQDKRSARNDRAFGRQETKRFKRESKTNQNIAAYSMGIDPKASMWQGIASLGQSTSSAVSSFSPSASLKGGLGGFIDNAIQNPDGSKNNTMIYVIIGGVLVVLIFLFKPKR